MPLAAMKTVFVFTYGKTYLLCFHGISDLKNALVPCPTAVKRRSGILKQYTEHEGNAKTVANRVMYPWNGSANLLSFAVARLYISAPRLVCTYMTSKIKHQAEPFIRRKLKHSTFETLELNTIRIATSTCQGSLDPYDKPEWSKSFYADMKCMCRAAGPPVNSGFGFVSKLTKWFLLHSLKWCNSSR